MKIQKSLFIIFLLMANIINCEDGRTYIINLLEKYSKRVGQTTFPKNFVESYKANIIDVIFDTIEPSEIDDAKIIYNLPDSLIKQAKSVKVNEPIIKENVKENNPYDIYELNLNIARKEDNGKITLALITTRSNAKAKKQKFTISVRVCEKVAIIFKKCHDEQRTGERDLNNSEKSQVISWIRFTTYKKLLEVVDILKKGNKFIRNEKDINL